MCSIDAWIKLKMKKVLGFTLVELMVVIAVAALLVSIAIPSYHSSVRKGRRAAAQAELVQFAGVAERIFTQTNSYATATAVEPADTDFYTYSFADGPDADSFILRATPTDIQSADKCGTMNLAHTGAKTNSGEAGDCPTWQ